MPEPYIVTRTTLVKIHTAYAVIDDLTEKLERLNDLLAECLDEIIIPGMDEDERVAFWADVEQAELIMKSPPPRP